MPFYLIQPAFSDNNSTQEPERQDQPPIFLIPGVLGNMNELKNLVTNLYVKNKGKNAIYVYQDGRLENQTTGSTVPMELTLEEQAKLIVNEMPAVPFQPFPFLLVGYSYGCALSAYVAQYLQALGHEPHLVFIDGPSPEASRNYFNLNKASATKDLISIVNYAAELSSLKSNHFDKEDIKTLAKKGFENRFKTISQAITNEQELTTNDNHLQFYRYLDVAKQNLKNLYAKNKISVILEKINLIITNETKTKYVSPSGGWEAYAKQVADITTESLANQTHTELLSEPKNNNFSCSEIAELIMNAFNAEVTKEQLFLKELLCHLEDYQKNNPEVKATRVITSFIQNKLISSPPGTGRSSPELETYVTTPPQLRSPSPDGGDDNMAIEMSTPSTLETTTSSDNNENDKLSKRKHQLGFFANSSMEIDNSAAYNTRQKDKERAQRLQSPQSSPSPRSPSSPGSRH